MTSSPITGLPTPPLDSSSGEKSSNPLQFTTLFIQNETNNNNSNLRFRKISQDPLPAKSGSGAAIYPTPGTPQMMGKMQNNYPGTPADSGIDTSFASSHYFTPIQPKRKLEAEFKSNYSPRRDDESFESPLDFFQRRFYRRRPALFSSDSRSVKPQHFLPILVVTVILASAVFTMFAFKAAVGRNYTENGDIVPSNGKYASMDYAVKNWMKKLQDSDKPNPYEVKGENGEILTGKKASMGYAFELKKRSAVQTENPIHFPVEKDENVGENMQDEEVEEVVETDESEPTSSREEKVKRKLLLDKLAKSGHFASSKVRPNKLETEKAQKETEVSEEAEVQEEEEETKEEEKTKEFEEKAKPGEVVVDMKKEIAKKKAAHKAAATSRNVKSKFPPVQTPNNVQSSFDSFNANVGFRANADEEDPFRFV